MLYRIWPLIRHLNKKYFFDYFLVLLLALLLFSWLQASPTLPEPDSFYHAKMATILSEGKILGQFPWLQETGLKDSFVDHHFLYHLLLVPFVVFLNPLVGVKLATVIFASLLVLVIYWLFKKFQLRYPFIFILILLTAHPWLFRASLVKAPAVFFIFVLLAFYFLAHQKWLRLVLISFFSVWLYAGWPLIIVLTIIYVLIHWLMEKFRKEESIWYKIENIFKIRKKTVYFRGILYAFGGVLAGLVINPYFPANLHFYWQQIVEIALVNYQKVIGVGGEWYAYGYFKLINDASLVCALFLVAILIFILTIKKQSIYSWMFLILALVFLILTFKSRRNVEFFIPLAVIFSAFSFGDYFKKLSSFHLKILMSVSWQAVFMVIALVFGVYFLLQIPRDVLIAKTDIENGWDIEHYQESAEWLKQNTIQGSIIFNADWDDFPFLFYYNSHNYYLTGLDPTFMYKKNQAKYWQYVNITLGKEYNNLKSIIQESYKANYVFLDKDHLNLNRILNYSKDFKKIYQDKEALIYQVIN